MASNCPLLRLPVELQFGLIKHLDRPSRVSLALTCPQMVHTFAKYSDLDRYRDNPVFERKLGVPRNVSFEDTRAQGAIIRWVTMPGSEEMEGSSEDVDPDAMDIDVDTSFEETDLAVDRWGFDEEEHEPAEEPYAVSAAGREDAAVQRILSEWIKKKCRPQVQGDVIFCGECWRFMCVSPVNGEDPWCAKMLTRDLWFRHCWPCEDAYGIDRNADIS